MSRRRRIAVAVALTAVAATTAWWWSRPRAAAPRVIGGGLAVGEQRSYDLTWDGTSVADASTLPGGAQAYTGEVHVRARLVLRGLSRDGDAAVVGYRLADVTTASYRVLGQDLLAGVDPTAGELIAVVEPGGGLRELRPDPAAAPAADLLLRAIAQQSVVTLADAATWDAAEPGPSGLARMRYQRRGHARLERTRTGYATLAALPGGCPTCRAQVDGTATITLARGGALRDLVDDERLAVTDAGANRLRVDNRFTLHATPVVARALPPPRLAGRQVLAAAATGLVGGDADLARARDWSMGRIGATVIRFLATGATPVETTWMHGVAAYLRLHPEACTELLRMFGAPGLPATGRELIASMLTAAGTPAAQAALRDGVDWLAQAHADAEVASVLTRAALLTRPTPETLAWLAAQRAPRADHAATAWTATLALGAAIGHLGDAALAARYAQGLRDELAAAEDPGARIELLGALGNAGRADDADAIGGLAHDPDAAVRQQVTLAVRKLPDAAAVPTLTTLAGDGDATVRAAALQMLGQRDLDAAAADRVAAATLAAGARSDDLGAVIALLAPHAADAAVAARLRALLDVVQRAELRAQIHHALGAAA